MNYFPKTLKRILFALAWLSFFGVIADKSAYLVLNAPPAKPKNNNKSTLSSSGSFSPGESSGGGKSGKGGSKLLSSPTSSKMGETKDSVAFGGSPSRSNSASGRHRYANSTHGSFGSDSRGSRRHHSRRRTSMPDDSSLKRQHHTPQFQSPAPRSSRIQNSFSSRGGSGRGAQIPQFLPVSFYEQQNAGLRKLPLPQRIRNFIEEKLPRRKVEEDRLRSEFEDEDDLLEAKDDLLKREEEQEKEKTPGPKNPDDKTRQQDLADEVQPQEVPKLGSITPAAHGTQDSASLMRKDQTSPTQLATLVQPVKPAPQRPKDKKSQQDFVDEAQSKEVPKTEPITPAAQEAKDSVPVLPTDAELKESTPIKPIPQVKKEHTPKLEPIAQDTQVKQESAPETRTEQKSSTKLASLMKKPAHPIKHTSVSKPPTDKDSQQKLADDVQRLTPEPQKVEAREKETPVVHPPEGEKELKEPPVIEKSTDEKEIAFRERSILTVNPLKPRPQEATDHVPNRMELAGSFVKEVWKASPKTKETALAEKSVKYIKSLHSPTKKVEAPPQELASEIQPKPKTDATQVKPEPAPDSPKEKTIREDSASEVQPEKPISKANEEPAPDLKPMALSASGGQDFAIELATDKTLTQLTPLIKPMKQVDKTRLHSMMEFVDFILESILPNQGGSTPIDYLNALLKDLKNQRENIESDFEPLIMETKIEVTSLEHKAATLGKKEEKITKELEELNKRILAYEFETKTTLPLLIESRFNEMRKILEKKLSELNKKRGEINVNPFKKQAKLQNLLNEVINPLKEKEQNLENIKQQINAQSEKIDELILEGTNILTTFSDIIVKQLQALIKVIVFLPLELNEILDEETKQSLWPDYSKKLAEVGINLFEIPNEDILEKVVRKETRKFLTKLFSLEFVEDAQNTMLKFLSILQLNEEGKNIMLKLSSVLELDEEAQNTMLSAFELDEMQILDDLHRAFFVKGEATQLKGELAVLHKEQEKLEEEYSVLAKKLKQEKIKGEKREKKTEEALKEKEENLKASRKKVAKEINATKKAIENIESLRKEKNSDIYSDVQKLEQLLLTVPSVPEKEKVGKLLQKLKKYKEKLREPKEQIAQLEEKKKLIENKKSGIQEILAKKKLELDKIEIDIQDKKVNLEVKEEKKAEKLKKIEEMTRKLKKLQANLNSLNDRASESVSSEDFQEFSLNFNEEVKAFEDEFSKLGQLYHITERYKERKEKKEKKENKKRGAKGRFGGRTENEGDREK